MNRPNRAWQFSAIAIFPVLVALLAAVYLDDPYQYLNYLREDSLVEWLSFACLALSGLIALDIGIRILRRDQQFQWFFFAFGIFCLLMAFEEISWGQRLFSLTSPEYFLGNSDQQEINVHNVLQQKLDFKTKDVAALVLSVYGVLMPLLSLNRHVAALLQRFRMLVPPLYLIPGFLIASLLMFDIPTGFEEEIGEFLFGLCFLLFMLHELMARGMGLPAEADGPSGPGDEPMISLDRFVILALTVAAFGLHVWQLDAKGFWLPEANHAAAALAPPGEIIRHGWLSGTFERSGWLLLLGVWKPLVGPSEFALRLLSALAATTAVPLLWQTLKVALPNQVTLRLFATLLLTMAPALHFYAQDVSIYGLLMTLALLSLYLTMRLCRVLSGSGLLLWVAVAWLLTLAHPFSAILVLVEAITLVTLLPDRGFRKVGPIPTVFALFMAFVPGLLWLFFSPGTAPAFASATTILDPDDWSRTIRMEQLWKDLTFGNALWLSYRSRLAVVMVPIFISGSAVLLLRRQDYAKNKLSIGGATLAWLLLASVLAPISVALFVLPALPTVATLYSLPALLIVCAIGAIYLLRAVPLVGGAVMLLAVGLAVTGLVTYHSGVAKSGYQTLAMQVNEKQQTNDGVLLVAPSQHFLADYYFETENTRAVPQMELSPYWPQKMSPLVPHEVDGEIQAALREHSVLWLTLYDENSVDPGRFLPAYLTAVAYRDGCMEWDDVELCRFVSPSLLETESLDLGEYLFAGELGLNNAMLTVSNESIEGVPMLLTQFDWEAVTQPSADYKVSLRLVDVNGEVVAQRDDFPIGPLLPPTVWGGGDRKSGYMALPLPEFLPAGRYAVQLALYNPADMRAAQYQTPAGKERSDPLTFATVDVDDADIVITAP
jgi:hypothetical protein